MHKYNAQKTTVDGITFDSKAEAFKIKKKMFLAKYPDILFRIYKKGRVVDE